MPRLNKIIAVIVAGLLIGSSTQSIAGGMRLGVIKCGQWVKERSDRTATPYEFWLLGYLSGVSMVADKEFLKGMDAASLELWMDNYCRSNPLNSIGQGGDALALELIKRM